MAAGPPGKAWDGPGDCEGTWLGTTARSDSEVIGGESHHSSTLNRSTSEIKFNILNFTDIFVLIYLVNDDRRKVTIPFTSSVSKPPSIPSTEVLPIIATT